jgi:hypothetical protein
VDLNSDGDAVDVEEDLNGNGALDLIDGVPLGTWTIKVVGESVTLHAPHLKDFAGSPISADPDGAAQPFALAVAGGFLTPGHTAAGFDRDRYDCSDTFSLSVADSALRSSTPRDRWLIASR